MTQNLLRSSAVCVLAGIALLGLSASAQESVLPPCVAPQPAAKVASNSSANAAEFYDEPHFTVAGVQDASQTGGHGSDTVRRTTERLAKETVALGTVTSTSKKANEDEASLRASIARTPDDAVLHHSLGNIEERKGDSLAAVQEYQRAAELNPSEINLFDWGAELLLHRAYEPAGEVFAKGRHLFPASVRMAVGLGVAAYAMGSYDLAAQRFCEASDVNPADPAPYLFLGKLQTIDSSLVPAVLPGVTERLARFAHQQPTNAYASYYYALTLYKHGDGSSEASGRTEALLKKAVELDPRLAVAYLQLGVIYAVRKDWLKTIEALRAAVKADPELEEGHYRLASAYRISGEQEKSKAELEVYQRSAKKHDGEVERDRHEIVQFVYSSRTQALER